MIQNTTSVNHAENLLEKGGEMISDSDKSTPDDRLNDTLEKISQADKDKITHFFRFYRILRLG